MIDALAPRSTPEEMVLELSKALQDAMSECYRHNRDYHHSTSDEKFKYWSWLLNVPYRDTLEAAGFILVPEPKAKQTSRSCAHVLGSLGVSAAAGYRFPKEMTTTDPQACSARRRENPWASA